MYRDRVRAFITNWDQPMPLHRKVSRLVVNLLRRIALRKDCCGHPGEPGC